MKPTRPGAKSERLDVVICERGLAPSRAKAQALILAGQVLSDGRRLDKPGQRIAQDLPLEVISGPKYVSRAGTKLETALARMAVEPTDRLALDVGASTGGFTQALLEAGASRVIALDVGRGQLDWGLRNDPRVVVFEGKNARYLEAHELEYAPELAVIDVSFISLKLVLPAVVRCLAPRGEILALVKPQFEVGRGKVERGGIVRDTALHVEVLTALATFAVESGWGVHGICPSGLRGARGNQEFFILIRPGLPGLSDAEIAAAAHRAAQDPDGN